MHFKILLFLLLTAFASCSNIGKSLPALQVQSLEGQVVSNKDLEGKIVVINVWATWCGTCLTEIPALNALTEKYADNPDVVFLAFSDETTDKVTSLLNSYPFNYQQFINAQGITDKLQTRLVKTYPQNIVVGRDGKVIFDVTDATSDIYKKLDEAISNQL